MAKYFTRTCPRCTGYIGVVLREPGRNGFFELATMVFFRPKSSI
jgi:hypothetical protein